jgi:hypothetical protein
MVIQSQKEENETYNSNIINWIRTNGARTFHSTQTQKQEITSESYNAAHCRVELKEIQFFFNI